MKLQMTEISTDYSDASATLAFDLKNNCWSEEILKMLGIPKEWFPMCYSADAPTEHVCRAAALQTGLSKQTIVTAGGGDQVMQGIGNGVVKEGDACVNIGTTDGCPFKRHTNIESGAEYEYFLRV